MILGGFRLPGVVSGLGALSYHSMGFGGSPDISWDPKS